MTVPSPQHDPEPPARSAPFGGEDGGRDYFATRKLAIVLSHYRLGVIEDLAVYARGSRRAPKMKITSRAGEFLIKRRAVGGNDPFRVAFSHAIQLHLDSRGFPVARLIGTRDDNNSMLNLDGRIYEVFEYVQGRRYDKSEQQSFNSGRCMARLHDTLHEFDTAFEAPTGSFHGMDADAHFGQMAGAVNAVEPDVDRPALESLCARLHEAYRIAVDRVDRMGFRTWTPTTIHGDWHPGNLLFRGDRVVAVLDFDSARLEPRTADIANGIMQFAIRMRDPSDPRTWPAGLDATRLGRFIAGYSTQTGSRLRPEELQVVPWLMIEALIIESLVPIATTGSFARIPGSLFLEMVARKVKWLTARAEKLVDYLEEHCRG